MWRFLNVHLQLQPMSGVVTLAGLILCLAPVSEHNFFFLSYEEWLQQRFWSGSYAFFASSMKVLAALVPCGIVTNKHRFQSGSVSRGPCGAGIVGYCLCSITAARLSYMRNFFSEMSLPSRCHGVQMGTDVL